MTEEELQEYHKKKEEENIQLILERARTASQTALMSLESDVFAIYWSIRFNFQKKTHLIITVQIF